MKKNTKGFTLIELLAVIVILAIIALIAVPVIMNIITRARKSAAADSAYSVLKAGELYYANQLLDNPDEAFTETLITFDNGVAKIGTTELGANSGFELKGTKPSSGTLKITAGGIATIQEDLVINGFKCSGSNTISCGE